MREMHQGPVTRTIAADRQEAERQTRRQLLFLLAAGAAWLWSAQAFGEGETDEDGRPIRLPGETPTPDTRAREREAIERSRNDAIENRARDRSVIQQQQQQQNRNDAIQRELNVQRNFDQQRLDILNNRDKP
jgi:hypothetical protein